MRVIILGYKNRTGVPETIASLRPSIKKFAEVVLEDLSGTADLSRVAADVALVFGGDGSILRAVQQMGKHQLPLLSINLGRLGFLAGLARNDDLLSVLKQLSETSQTVRAPHRKREIALPDGFTLSEHRLLKCSLIRGTKTEPHKKVASALVMNEVAIQSADFHMLELRLWADDECITTCRCDGMLLSTPIGSTAHNLSVGGPILRHGLDAVVLSPIAPHSMTFRPVVDSSQRTYRFRLVSSTGKTAVVVDGRKIGFVTEKDCVVVRPSDIFFHMLNVPGYSYYSRLQNKLEWGGGLHDIQ